MANNTTSTNGTSSNAVTTARIKLGNDDSRVSYYLDEKNHRIVAVIDLDGLMENQIYLTGTGKSVNLAYGSGKVGLEKIGIADSRLQVTLTSSDEDLMAIAEVKPETVKTKEKTEKSAMPEWMMKKLAKK